MKILIAGSNLNAKLIAYFIKLQNPEHDIFITTEEPSKEQIYTPLDIKENDITSLCDFVKYNQIEFTIAVSELSIINGIADEFKKEGFIIFAPTAQCARITFFNSIAKKIMYKLKINTPRFGIFDRENIAIDYIRNIRFPIILENDFTLFSHEAKVYTTFQEAKTALQKAFETPNNKIVIENYINEEPIYIYFITDGYSALPLITINKSNNKKEIYAPSDKITDNMLINITKRIIYPVLDDISKYTEAYCGILGIKLKIKNNNIYVSEFYNGFQDFDIQAFLSLLNDDLATILYNASIGALSDTYDCINLKDEFSYTIQTEKEIEIETNHGLIESKDERNYYYTTTELTLNKAKSLLTKQEEELII